MSVNFNKNDDLRRSRGLAGFRNHDYSDVPTVEYYDDDRAEKPWQRVPSSVLILLLGFYLLLGYFTQLVEDAMPSVVLESSLAADNSDTFSEEVALRYLNEMVGEGPRVAGTIYHLEKTRDMKNMVDRIAADARIRVRTDWQMVSGDYYLNSTSPFVNVYDNCSNIIALLEGESGFHSNGTIGSSILVNCHYDSVPFAKGASDNVVFCAAMAESLSRLSKRTNRLKHNVIFLFNGAEENPLQASHAFLHHPWAQGVISVINLDAGGMNGKPSVFQVTDPRVLNAYSRAAGYPTAQGMGEFLFQSGIIPSDTDFRIFRDFGDIHGVDIAFTKWGNVYHTRNDKPELIKPGVIQGAGDMLLAFIREVADSTEMDHKVTPTTAIYYDCLHVFMLTYSFTVSYVVDTLIAILGLASVTYYLWLVGLRWSSVKELLWTGLGRFLATLAGVVVTAICTALMVATTVQMRYLSQMWIVVPLYWLPFGLAAVATSQAYDAWRSKRSGLSRSLRTLQAMASTRLLMSVITLVLVCIPPLNTMRYLFSVPLFMMSITSIASITILRYVNLRGWQHLIMEAVLSIPLVMWTCGVVLRLDSMMLPIMGRSSSDTPDFTVAMLNVGLVVLFAATVSGIELLFSRKRLWMVLSALGIATLIIMFVPFSPYEDDGTALQRHYWFHSEITSFSADGSLVSNTSGVLVTKLDPYTIDHVVSSLGNAGYNASLQRGFGDNCNHLLYCGMPLYRTSFGRHYTNAMLIPTGSPAPFTPTVSFNLENKTCSGDICTYNFTMTGGPHNMITFWPYANVTLERWSLQSPVTSSYTQLERPVYVVFHSTCTYMEQWIHRFSLVFRVPQSLQSGVIMEVSHHSHKLYHPNDYTDEYRRLIEAMPKYFNIAPAMSFRHDYVF